MDSLSPGEKRRLSVLRIARELGMWPAPVVQTFSARHGITLDPEPEPSDMLDRTIYRCRLGKIESGDEFYARFQVMAAHPEPPSADEVLRWLAMTVAHLRHTSTVDSWHALHYLTVGGAERLHPYRGLVRPKHDSASFMDSLVMEAHQFFAFLGQPAFDELIESVDAGNV